MAGPVWARWVFALLIAGIGVYRTTRLLAARRGPDATRTPDVPATDRAQLLMAAGMTVMFVPVATPVPPVWWATVFAVDTVWLGLRLLGTARAAAAPDTGPRHGRTHLVSHVLASAVMAYMFAALPTDGLSGSGPSHSGHLSASSTAFAAVGWLAVAYFLAHAVGCGVRMAGPVPKAGTRDGTAPAGAVTPTAALRQLRLPRSALPSGLVMGLGMSYMLMTML